jgi:hypothetical protein
MLRIDVHRISSIRDVHYVQIYYAGNYDFQSDILKHICQLVCGDKSDCFLRSFVTSEMFKHSISETGSTSSIRCKVGKVATQLGPVRISFQGQSLSLSND